MTKLFLSWKIQAEVILILFSAGNLLNAAQYLKNFIHPTRRILFQTQTDKLNAVLNFFFCYTEFMHYEKIVSGIFIDRPNRFIAHVDIGGTTETVHVKNTGRCKELLIPGVKVYLEDFEGRMANRKLRYSLIAVEKVYCGKKNTKTILINMDSQAPNKVVGEWLATQEYDFIKPEFTFGNSRVDFYMERGTEKFLLEVKGCTLESDGHCFFPDAPTERGVKHLEELMKAKEQGYHAAVLILIQMEQAIDFAPNDETHKAFGDTLRLAASRGVEVLCYNCRVTPDSLELKDKVKVVL